MPPHDNPVPAFLDAYRVAVFAKDVEAFAALYDEDVRVFDMWGQWTHHGLAAWRDMASGWFGSLGGERVVVAFTDIHCDCIHELAVGHAFARFTAIDVAGTTLRALDNRISVVLRRRAGAWKVVHEHSSAPLAFETTKAILQR